MVVITNMIRCHALANSVVLHRCMHAQCTLADRSRLRVPKTFKLQPHDRGLVVTYLKTPAEGLVVPENNPWRERLSLPSEERKVTCSQCLMSRDGGDTGPCMLHPPKHSSMRRPSTPAVLLTAGTPGLLFLISTLDVHAVDVPAACVFLN